MTSEVETRFLPIKLALGADLFHKIQTAKLFVVGAGGIGCELLKNLVQTGFIHITILDLDTIDVSNLNRQFLFRKKHVGFPKAAIAREAALQYNPLACIEALHMNIMDEKFSPQYMQQFDLVLSALDNIEARKYLNKLCYSAQIPLIESGTQGYNGQVYPILHALGECKECQKTTPPKTFAVCTIRNTPDKPEHCIEWAKVLFAHFFGPPDKDDDDENGRNDGGDSQDDNNDDENGDNMNNTTSNTSAQDQIGTYSNNDLQSQDNLEKYIENSPGPLITDEIVQSLRQTFILCQQLISSLSSSSPSSSPQSSSDHNSIINDSIRQYLTSEIPSTTTSELITTYLPTCYEKMIQHFLFYFLYDIFQNRLASGRWTTRQPPQLVNVDPINVDTFTNILQQFSIQNAAQTQQTCHDIIWYAAQFIHTGAILSARQMTKSTASATTPSETTTTTQYLIWDKDDLDAMLFVSAAANLRMFSYHIPIQSDFVNKGIAGKIIHAIATTNAIAAGLLVTQSISLLRHPTLQVCPYINREKQQLVQQKLQQTSEIGLTWITAASSSIVQPSGMTKSNLMCFCAKPQMYCIVGNQKDTQMITTDNASLYNTLSFRSFALMVECTIGLAIGMYQPQVYSSSQDMGDDGADNAVKTTKMPRKIEECTFDFLSANKWIGSRDDFDDFYRLPFITTSYTDTSNDNDDDDDDDEEEEIDSESFLSQTLGQLGVQHGSFFHVYQSDATVHTIVKCIDRELFHPIEPLPEFSEQVSSSSSSASTTGTADSDNTPLKSSFLLSHEQLSRIYTSLSPHLPWLSHIDISVDPSHEVLCVQFQPQSQPRCDDDGVSSSQIPMISFYVNAANLVQYHQEYQQVLQQTRAQEQAQELAIQRARQAKWNQFSTAAVDVLDDDDDVNGIDDKKPNEVDVDGSGARGGQSRDNSTSNNNAICLDSDDDDNNDDDVNKISVHQTKRSKETQTIDQLPQSFAQLGTSTEQIEVIDLSD